jgi:hypothetical protein
MATATTRYTWYIMLSAEASVTDWCRGEVTPCHQQHGGNRAEQGPESARPWMIRRPIGPCPQPSPSQAAP